MAVLAFSLLAVYQGFLSFYYLLISLLHKPVFLSYLKTNMFFRFGIEHGEAIGMRL